MTTSPPLRIPTDRLTLEGVAPSAAAGLRAGGGGGFVWLGGGPFEGTRDAAGMLVKAYVSGVHRPEFGLYVLVGRTEIGYDLVEAARGHGYATEALRALAAWALARDDVRRLFAVVEQANTASQAVLERAGFVLVAGGEDEGEREGAGAGEYAYELSRPGP